jgi:hypothetical protein
MYPERWSGAKGLDERQDQARSQEAVYGQPGAVGLAPRHLGRRGAQSSWVAVGPGAAERPGVGQIGQVADAEGELGIKCDAALER